MGVSKMAKRKKGIIITSTCALLAGAAVIAELALGGGTGGNGVGRQQGWQNLQKEIFDSASEKRGFPYFLEQYKKTSGAGNTDGPAVFHHRDWNDHCTGCG